MHARTSLLLLALLLCKLQTLVLVGQKQVIFQHLKCLLHVKMATEVNKKKLQFLEGLFFVFLSGGVNQPQCEICQLSWCVRAIRIHVGSETINSTASRIQNSDNLLANFCRLCLLATNPPLTGLGLCGRGRGSTALNNQNNVNENNVYIVCWAASFSILPRHA